MTVATRYPRPQAASRADRWRGLRAAALSLTGMAPESHGERFRLWRRLLPLVSIAVVSLLPCPDLVSRFRVRRAAARLVSREPWPGEDAKGQDAAQLALFRLLWLQKQTRRAVRGRHQEAAVMLARSATETLILGTWCVRDPGAVTALDSAAAEAARNAVRYVERAFGMPEHVISECIKRLASPRPAKKVWTMAEIADEATGTYAARDLYQRLYVPLSSYSVHAGAGSLMRHVRPGGAIRRRPARSWNRRSPVRVADTCLGYLAAAVAQDSGQPHQRFIDYGDRHNKRTLLPMVFMIAGHTAGSARRNPRRAITIAARTAGLIRDLGSYTLSAQFTSDPQEVRTSRIRDAITAMTAEGSLDEVLYALQPFIDYLAARIAEDPESESVL
jgi:hypothetical protein